MNTFRKFVVLLVVAFCATTVEARTVSYHDADNGLLGTMQRVTKGEAGFTRLANILSLVAKDNHLTNAGLLRLRGGQKILVRERYLVSSYRPSARTIAASKAMMMEVSSSRKADKALIEKWNTERKIFQKKISDLKQELATERETTRSAMQSAELLRQETEKTIEATIKHAENSDREVSRLKAKIWPELARQIARSRFTTKAVFVLFGLMLGILFGWTWFHTKFTNENEVYKKVRWARAPNREKMKFTYDGKHNGYTCEECQNKFYTLREAGKSPREIGVGILPHNFVSHLDNPEIHPELRMFKVKAA